MDWLSASQNPANRFTIPIMEKPKAAKSDLLLALVALMVVAMGAYWFIGSQKATCSLQMRNYNTCINSCGMDETADEAWKDPAKTEALVLKLFKLRIPKCPSGGTCSVVLGKRPYLPKVVCSMEHSRGHFSPD